MPHETIAVLFGGRSVEHEVSIITGHQVMDALETAGYSVLPIYITKQGEWYAGKPLQNLALYREQTFHASAIDGIDRVSLSPDRSIRELVRHPRAKKKIFGKEPTLWADVFLPTIHGTFGEDGTLQGLFEMADVPYVGPGVLAAALGMDKAKMKEFYTGVGLPMLKCTVVTRNEWKTSRGPIIESAESQIQYPCIVKPVSLGSSIGVKSCPNREALIEALDVAVTIDDRALIERALVDFIEINCSVLGPPYRTSVCEQPARQEAVLSFDDKYKHGAKKLGGGGLTGQGMAGLTRIVPAPIGEELTRRVQQLSLEAFRSIGASGVARVDFLYDRSTNDLFLNEINTTPGSFAYYLWEGAGLMFPQLVTELVNTALDRHRSRSETEFSFATNLLSR